MHIFINKIIESLIILLNILFLIAIKFLSRDIQSSTPRYLTACCFYVARRKNVFSALLHSPEEDPGGNKNIYFTVDDCAGRRVLCRRFI